MLANLTEAQLRFAREDEDERLPPEFLDQPTFDPQTLGLNFRSKRQGPTEPRRFSDEDVLMALENENACNAIVRASANSIIENLEE